MKGGSKMPIDDDSPVIPCSTVGTREIEICVPVTVRPFANVGDTKVRCCGEAIYSAEQCRGIPGGECNFNILQRICVEVPIEFGAEIDTDEMLVACGISGTYSCANCPNLIDPLDPDDPDDPDDPTDPDEDDG